MIDQLVDPLGSEVQQPAQRITLARGIFPWGDVNARDVPEDWLTMAPEIIGTLSLLSGLSPSGAKAVAVDDAGGVGISTPRLAAPVLQLVFGQQFTEIIPVPAGAQVLHMFMSVSTAPITSIAVSGIETGTNYLNLANLNDFVGEYYVPVSSALDHEIQITGHYGANIGNPSRLNAEWILGPVLSFPQLINNALPEHVTNAARSTVGAIEALPVGAQILKISASPVSGASVTLLAGVVNQSIKMYKGRLSANAAEAGTIFSLQDIDTPNDFDLFDLTTSGPWGLDYMGAALPVGKGLGIHNYAAAQHSMHGYLMVVQN